MFDVRPVGKNGCLDLEKINAVSIRASGGMDHAETKNTLYEADASIAHREYPEYETRDVSEQFENQDLEELAIALPQNSYFDFEINNERQLDFYRKKSNKKNKNKIKINWNIAAIKKSLVLLAGATCAALLIIFVPKFFDYGLAMKEHFLKNGKIAYANLAEAKMDILNKDFQGSSANFNAAYENFDKISSELNSFGGTIAGIVRYIPYFSKISSGKYLADAGRDISKAGALMSSFAGELNLKLNGGDDNEAGYFLETFRKADKNCREIVGLLDGAQKNLDKINFDDVPEEYRGELSELKNQIPEMRNVVAGFVNSGEIIGDILGGNGPRKYLFLFQNNNEMRATGGFIGTYGLMDIFNGKIKKFFIDGIFNPDGQLREKVVPPFPIQKISANWSLHDSNWFPDFPVSAEKAVWFFEKTGGPTVDGVISMTPEVLRDFLEITGPIEMPEYGVVVNSDNFLEKIQQEVEIDYDKELNQPKKILSDLAPKIMDKIFSLRGLADIKKAANILGRNLNEKHILIYSRNYKIEKKLSELDWSGEILGAQKDYVSVINTNINGFKTDGVIDETIEHLAEIQSDGSIIDTLTITRKHNGGNTAYEWWNKVNANYMRVYVPNGSQFISVEGQTREFDPPPLDYDALGFKRDPQVEMEEESIRIDEESGTRIYEDAGKTVFGNWTYVSPQETLVIKYKYLLPFKVRFGEKDQVDSFSLLAQKQAGSVGSKFISEIKFPAKYIVKWKYPEELSTNETTLKLEADLKTNKFIGAAFVE